MSANINSMAFAGAVPWHGLGANVTAGADIDTWLKEAGLTWPVIAAPVKYEIDGKLLTHTDKVIVRKDTGVVFDTVGPKYIPFQNSQVLEFFREYVEVGDMQIETAGALGTGEVVWALAKMDAAFDLGKGKVDKKDLKAQVGSDINPSDTVMGYVLISNPHKYGKGAVVKFTAVRVVCSNTLAMALNGAGQSLHLPHTREFNETYRTDAKTRLGIARERMQAFQEDAEKLVDTPLNLEDAKEVLTSVFGEQERVRESILTLYSGEGKGAMLPTAKDTAWGLLNATTQYFDWHSGRKPEVRLKSAWYGTGASKKQQMLSALLQQS